MKRDVIAGVVAVVVAAVATAVAAGIFDRPDRPDRPSAAGEEPAMTPPERLSPSFSDGGNARVAYFRGVAEALHAVESFTVVVVAGASRDEVARMLHVDLSRPVNVDDLWDEDVDHTGWALIDVAGGVLAVEPSGYGDPTLDTLRELSADGRAVAVLRDNIQAHERFGAARDGELLFDDDEFKYIEDPAVVPDELRDLFDLVWDDLEGELDVDAVVDSTAVSLAMAEVVTGLTVTAADLATVSEAPYFAGPSLVYAGSLDE